MLEPRHYNSKRRLSLLSLAVAHAITFNVANAATIIVTTDSDQPAIAGCTLRDAIISINQSPTLSGNCQISSGVLGIEDTITFALPDDSTIDLSSGSLGIIKGMVIDGSMVENLTISGNSNNFRVFSINGIAIPGSPPISDITINNLTISGGNVDDSSLSFTEQSGGGIRVFGNVDLYLDYVTLSDNRAGYGGGLASQYGANVTISNSTIVNNIATAAGGVMSDSSSDIVIEESTISNNQARALGGGIGIRNDGYVDIIDSTISLNRAQAIPDELADGEIHVFEPSEGGGISVSGNGSRLIIRKSSIIENQGALGGGIHIIEDAFAVTYASQISHNQSTFINEVDKSGGGDSFDISYQSGSGGGVFIGYEGSAFIVDTSINHNSTPSSGGGISVVMDSRVFIYESSITDNHTTLGGGGIAVISGSHANIINSTISTNSATAGSGGGIFALSNTTLGIRNSTFSYNSASSTAGGIFSGGDTSELSLLNTIITGNMATTYADFADPDGSLIIGGNVSAANIIGDDSKTFDESMLISGLTLFPTSSDILATTTDRGGAPNDTLYSVDQIIRPISLLANGTYAHKLPNNSPAVDAGNSFFCNQVLLGDQTGARRDELCDIGSIELDQSLCVVIPTENGSIVSFCL